MKKEDPRQCQALTRNKARCQCKAQNFYKGLNLCNKHMWEKMAAKPKENKE